MSMGEILLILFVYLLLFGAKGVPALAQSLGKAVFYFRNAAKDVQSEIMKSANEIRKEADLKLDQVDLDSPSRPAIKKPGPPQETPPSVEPTVPPVPPVDPS